MEFGGQYLTYDEYRQLGGTLDIVPFNLFELEARTNIDRETQNRLEGGLNIPPEVKMCMFRLVEGMAFDGLYKDVKPEQKEAYINELIYNCLVGTGLLFRGI